MLLSPILPLQINLLLLEVFAFPEELALLFKALLLECQGLLELGALGLILQFLQVETLIL